MGAIIPAWRIFARRGLSNWRMLAVLAVGVLVAATLLASAPIYARTMADLGLTFVIREDLRDLPSTRVEFPNTALQTEDGRALRDAVERRIDQRIGWFEASRSRYLRIQWMTIAKQGQAAVQTNPLGQVQSLTGYESHVKVVGGRLPAATGPGQPMEIALPSAAYRLSGLKVGDAFTFNEDFDTCERTIPPPDVIPPPFPCAPQATARFRFPAVLVGVVDPADADDQFWVQGTGRYFDLSRPLPDYGPVLPMFTAEVSLLDSFGGLHPGYRAVLAYNVFANPERLSRTNFARARDDIHALYDEFGPIGGVAYSPLTTTLDNFGKSSKYEQVPLTILLLEIAGVALFYVVLMSAILVERQATEIALLRSRGATTIQVIAVSAFEGLAVGVPVMLVAPFLAAAATALLGLTPVFSGVTGQDLLPVTVPLLSFGMAGIGVVLSLLALVAPAFVVARRSAVSQRRAEGRPGVSILQRYYLDLALVAIAGLLLWELRERGSVFTPSAAGGVSSDPILLASPALIILAAAALLLRLYPLVLRLATRLFAAAAGVTVAIGLWQVVRSPGQYTRLTLLLMMAVAVGTFAASYSRTADRSYRDRAAYETGVDFRANGRAEGTLGTFGAAADAELAKLPGVTRGSAVFRTRASLALPGQSSDSLQVLALDPEAARSSLWFRSDFAKDSLGGLMDSLGDAGDLAGQPLPGDPATLSVWVYTAESRDQTTLWARVRDGQRLYDLVELGTLEGTGWRELKAPVHRALGPGLVGPISLLSLVMTEPSNRFSPAKTPIYFDDITVTDTAGKQTVIENFEAASRWGALPTKAVIQDKFELSTEQPHGGRGSGKMTLKGGTGGSGGGTGLFIQESRVPLPAVVSESFLAVAGLRVGGTTTIQVGDAVVPIVVRDTFRLFPTLGTSEGPGIVLNRDQLMTWINLSTTSNPPELNEGWFTLKDGADRDALEKALRDEPYALTTVADRQKRLASIEENPLIAAGGSGILFVAFVAVLVLVAAAMLVSLWMAVQRRRVEFAVLRALGLSRGQVFRLLAFEYALVAVVGVVAGAYLGLLVGRRMLSFLDVTESGGRVEPGFILETQWAVVAGGAAAVFGVFVVALVMATRLLAHSSDAQALRLE